MSMYLLCCHSLLVLLDVLPLHMLLFRLRFDLFWSTLGTALFLGFYPFLDWSTYFLTDTIGAFFWLTQIYFIYKYIQKPVRSTLIVYVFLMIVSLFNREQSILMVATIFIMWVGIRLFGQKKDTAVATNKLFIYTCVISLLFLVLNSVLKLPSLYDSWIYLESGFGYKTLKYSAIETAYFLTGELVKLHVGLAADLFRHRWWLLMTLLGFAGVYVQFLKKKETTTYRSIDVIFSNRCLCWINNNSVSNIPIFLPNDYRDYLFQFEFYPVVFLLRNFRSKINPERHSFLLLNNNKVC